MKKFTDEDAANLVDCAVELTKTTITDSKGPQPSLESDIPHRA